MSGNTFGAGFGEGFGAGEAAPDGSPVDVFARLPAGRGPAYIAAATRPGGTVLDLGCGAGRISHTLAVAGYGVVAVDVCPAMVARIGDGITAVVGDAASLDLGRRFDTVVLASYLVNHPQHAPAFLATCRHHVAVDGAVVIQRYDPVWARAGGPGVAAVGDVTIRVDRLEVRGTALDLSVTYGIGTRTWRQDVSASLVDDDTLDRLAGTAGLVVDGWLDEFRTWAVLRPSPAAGRFPVAPDLA